MLKKLSKISHSMMFNISPLFQMSVVITLPVLIYLCGWYTLLVLVLAPLYHLVGLSATGHMIISHGRSAGKFDPILYMIFFYTTFVVPGIWAGVHIQHHRYADTDKDPQSPRHYGTSSILIWKWRRDLIDRRTYLQHRRKPISHFFEKYFWMLLLVPLAAFLLLPASWVLLFWAVPASMALTMATVGAYFSHLHGEPRYLTLFETLFLVLGEQGDHAGHHGSPKTNSKLLGNFYD